MAANILFDSLGAQVEENNKTDYARLATWLSNLKSAGYSISYTNPANTISSQLTNEDLLITTTHQLLAQTTMSPADAIPAITTGFVGTDLGGIQNWVFGGGSILIFVNHGAFVNPPVLGDGGSLNNGPFWSINDIQLAASLGITITFASFLGNTLVANPCKNNQMQGTLSMSPNPNAPQALIQGVTTVQAWDSGGISPIVPANVSSTVLIPLPSTGCTDMSGLGYNPDDFAFSVLYQCGKGKVIVIGHSGIVGDNSTCMPSPGQINSVDNLTFLMNCVGYLTTAS